jgi:chromosomal replication initiation ATPase DnaA
MSQLSLLLPPVAPPPSPFIAAPSNEAALWWLDSPRPWPGGRLLLVAEAGAGKTHLLTDWARRRGGACVPGAALRFPPPEGALAVDDAERAPEEALLHVLNAAAEAGVPVLLAARRPPASWATRLPDLASRLRAVPVVEIGRAEDSLLRMLLAKMLAERQLAVPEAMRDWLLRQLPRSPAAIRVAAAALDGRLKPGGRITHALAASVVEDVAATRPSEET